MSNNRSGKRENHPKQVVYKWKSGRTDVWGKDSSGRTRNDLHSYTKDGQRYDHNGRRIGKA